MTQMTKRERKQWFKEVEENPVSIMKEPPRQRTFKNISKAERSVLDVSSPPTFYPQTGCKYGNSLIEADDGMTFLERIHVECITDEPNKQRFTILTPHQLFREIL